MSEERSLALATGNDLSVYNFELTTNGVQMSACRAGDNIVYPRGRAMSGEVYPCLAAGLRKGQNSQWASSGQPIIEPTYPALTCATDVHAVAVYDHAHAKESKVAVTITGDHESRVTDQMNMVVGAPSSCVRRLTPEECEALMGYPIGHTKVPYRGKPAEVCPDGPRYEACGNGWAINSARWVLLGIHRYLFNHQQEARNAED